MNKLSLTIMTSSALSLVVLYLIHQAYRLYEVNSSVVLICVYFSHVSVWITAALIIMNATGQ